MMLRSLPRTARKPRRRTHWLVTVALLLSTAGVAAFALPHLLDVIVRDKLQSLVASNLNGRLEIGAVRYSFPYGIRASNIRLFSETDVAPMLDIGNAEFSLVKLPFRGGPLLIRRIMVEDATANVIRNEDGSMAGLEMLRKKPRDPSKPRLTLSDLFQLRQLSIQNGKIRYEQRGPGAAAPMVWENLQTTARITPQTAGTYGWEFTANSPAAASITSTGTIDIDQLILDVSRLSIEASAGGSAQNALPPQVQRFLEQFGIEGKAILNADATLPLKDPAKSRFNSHLKLSNAAAVYRDVPFAGDMEITARKEQAEPEIELSSERIFVRASEGTLQVSNGRARIDPASRAWRLQELSANFDRVTLPLPRFSHPVEQLTGSMQVAYGQIELNHFMASCGKDRFTLLSARIPLSQSMHHSIEVRDINLAADFQQPGPTYPGKVGKALAEIRPAGPFDVRGWQEFIVGRSDRYEYSISTRGGALSPADQKIPLTNVVGDVSIKPEGAHIQNLTAELYRGTASATGNIRFDKTASFDGQIKLRNADVQVMSQALLSREGKSAALSGLADANLTVTGHGKARWLGVSGHGDASIRDGQLWEIPLFNGIVSDMKVAQNALRTAEAAAAFDIGDGRIHLRQAALNSPAVGLQGTGSIGFDGPLDLKVFAAPLGDWKQHVRNTRVPLVSNLVGEFAGGIQQVFNAAASRFLYEFHVRGVVGDPQIQAVPAPILTVDGARLFGRMLRGDPELLNAVRETPENRPAIPPG